MKARILAGAALGALLTLQPVQGMAQGKSDAARFLQNLLRTYTVLFVRSLVDFTYESISVDPLNGFVATGVKIYPPFEWLEDQEGEEECEISIGRLAETGVLGVDSLNYSFEVTDLVIPPVCLDSEAADFITNIGYTDGVTADTAVVEISYTLPTSSASISVQTVLNQAAALNAEAEFGYFWFAGFVEEDPYPVIQLTRAEISVENLGLFQRLEPMMSSMIGSPDTLPDMAKGGLTSELSENGNRDLTPAEETFVTSLSDALRSFVTEKRRISVEARPEPGTWLDENTFDSPGVLFQALRPVVSTTPHSRITVLSPELLSRAMAEVPDLSEEERMRAGTALMTGVGAPRDRQTGLALLLPLAVQGWNAEAAMVIARSLAEAGEAAAAYPYALVAMSAGRTEAIGLASQLESELSADVVAASQDAILTAYPEDPELKNAQEGILGDPDVGAMRKLAMDARLGRGLPRSYRIAYLWASLAAAAGDRSAAHLRADLDRMALQPGNESWRTAFQTAAGEALSLWTERGLGLAVHAQTTR